MSAWPHGLAYTLIAAQALMAGFGVYGLKRRPAPAGLRKAPFQVEPPVPVGTALASAHSNRRT